MLSQAGTTPLRNSGTRPLVDRAALRANTEAMITKGRQSLTNLEPRIELLMRSCLSADLAMPGVEVGDFKHPLSPKGEQIVAYLVSAYRQSAAIARSVQVAVFRFQDAAKTTDRAEAALAENTLQPALLEELKLKLFYLTRYHEEFKADRVLSQLFPAPQTAALPQKPGGTGQLSTVERLKAKQAQQALLHKAELLASRLAPKMEIIVLTLEMLDKPQGLNMGSLFTPTTRQARLISMGISTNPTLIEQLRETRALFAKLQELLPEARKTGEIDALKETIFPLSKLALTLRGHAMLKELFPLGEQDLFPPEKTPSGGQQWES